jgi:hypothetical protein
LSCLVFSNVVSCVLSFIIQTQPFLQFAKGVVKTSHHIKNHGVEVIRSVFFDCLVLAL